MAGVGLESSKFVESVAFRPDGRIVATAGGDHTPILWDVRDPWRPSELGRLAGHRGSVRSVTFSHNGQMAATGSYDGSVRLWSVTHSRRPQQLSTITSPGVMLLGATFDRTGDYLVTGGTDAAREWDVTDPRHPIEVLILRDGNRPGVICVAYRPDGRVLATSGYDGVVRLWHTEGWGAGKIIAAHSASIHRTMRR